MSLSTMSLEELQSHGLAGDQEAILELGRRVLEFDFCMSNTSYCEHRIELKELEEQLDTEIPPSCPRCDQWLTEK